MKVASEYTHPYRMWGVFNMSVYTTEDEALAEAATVDYEPCGVFPWEVWGHDGLDVPVGTVVYVVASGASYWNAVSHTYETADSIMSRL